MQDKDQHIVSYNDQARVALKALGELEYDVSRTLFVIDNDKKLVGTLTDGDIRRGLLSGLEISQPVKLFMNTDFKYLHHLDENFKSLKAYKNQAISLIPLLDKNYRLLQILDLKKIKTILPVAALIMAGGRGERLRPLTETIPKPMLIVGDKPIIEHNIDRLISYGIKDIYISVKYLKEHIISHFGDGSSRGVNIFYIEEDEPLGTLGALGLLGDIPYEDILVMNSDLLTNIDFEDFYDFYKEKGASMLLASVPYYVNIPYAVLETSDYKISSFSEKPSYTYYSNGGIYLLKYQLKSLFEKGSFFNATDLMEKIIKDENLIHYPFLGYWLDIGKPEDFKKAQEDIKHVKF